jgi:hypothetical protein
MPALGAGLPTPPLSEHDLGQIGQHLKHATISADELNCQL